MARKRRSNGGNVLKVVESLLPKRMGASARLIIFVVIVVLLALFRLVQDQFGDRQGAVSPPESLSEGIYVVEKVVDGDTLTLANGAKVRFIAIDTPETVKPNWPVEPFGPEASAFTKAAIERNGNQVYLRFDKERLDKYNRHLAYVYVADVLLNEALVRNGLARVELQYNNSAAMERLLYQAEQSARADRLGIWSLPESPAE